MISKIWNSMNDLEETSMKIVSAIELLNVASKTTHNSLIDAAKEFLEYYLKEFDEKFKIAWNETIQKSNGNKYDVKLELDNYSGDYYITLPKEVLNQINVQETDILEISCNSDHLIISGTK